MTEASSKMFLPIAPTPLAIAEIGSSTNTWLVVLAALFAGAFVWSYLKSKSAGKKNTESIQAVRELLSQEREIRRTIEYRIKAMEMSESMLSRFTSIPLSSVDSEIERALGEFGELVEADRAYVFRYEEGGLMSNTHEWCGEGVSAEKGNLQKLPVDMFPWWNERIQRGEHIFVPDINAMPPEAAAEQEILQAQNIKSLIVVPMVMRSAPEGFIGYDAVKQKQAWPAEVVTSLRTIGEIFSNAIDDKLDTMEIERSHDELQAVIERAPVAYLLVDSDGIIRAADGLSILGIGESLDQTVSESFGGQENFLDALVRAKAGETVVISYDIRTLTLKATLRPLRGAGLESVVFVDFRGEDIS